MKTTLAGRDMPYWWLQAAPLCAAPAALPKSTDVAIIGAGYAGLAAAITLARAGRSVTVLDKLAPGEGASTRNGGITSGNLRVGQAELARRFGQKQADAFLLEAKRAREDLYAFIAAEGVACDLQMVGRFAGALNRRQYEALARESDHLTRTLGIEAHAVPGAESRDYVGTDFYQGGSVRMDIGGINPAKLHRSMLDLAEAAGATVIGQTTVQRVGGTPGDFTLGTDRGSLRARDVISATNGYVDQLDRWLQRRIVPVRSRIIVTDPLPKGMMDQVLPKRMMVSDKRQLTYYYRPTPDGTRLLFGGRDGTFSGNADWPTAHLRHEMLRIFPQLEGTGIAHSWFGNVAMNRDMLPRIFSHDGIHYATGCCGSGIVWMRWAGQKVAEKILGAGTRSVFDFDPPKSVPFFRGTAWFMPAVFAAKKLQDKFSQF